MNRQQIRSVVREVLREPVAARWSDTLINTYINNALGEIEKALLRTKTDTVNVEAGQERVPLPEDFYILSTLYWDANEIKRQLSRVPTTEDEGIPNQYWLINNEIYLRPIPDKAGTVKFEYYYTLPRLNTDDDTPSLPGLENFIKAHAVYEAYFDDTDPRFEIWKQRKTEELITLINGELANYSTGFKVDERW